MDQIVFDLLLTGKGLDPLHELGDVIRQLLPGDRVLRPGRDVDHTVPVTQLVQDVRYVVVLRAREHVHVDAHLPQLAGQFTDINIHPAGILPSQGRQRTGMIGNHRNS